MAAGAQSPCFPLWACNLDAPLAEVAVESLIKTQSSQRHQMAAPELSALGFGNLVLFEPLCLALVFRVERNPVARPVHREVRPVPLASFPKRHDYLPPFLAP